MKVFIEFDGGHIRQYEINKEVAEEVNRGRFLILKVAHPIHAEICESATIDTDSGDLITAEPNMVD